MIDENGNRMPDPKPHVIRENGLLWLKDRDGRLHMLSQEECFELLSSCMRALNGQLRKEVYGQPHQST